VKAELNMKIRRIPKEENVGFCHDCHNRAQLEVTFGSKRSSLRLSMRHGRYLGGVILSRIGEHEAGIPIPRPGERVPAQEWGKSEHYER
jgi:hypothetical protein